VIVAATRITSGLGVGYEEKPLVNSSPFDGEFLTLE
jgi:hypothetical protein